MAATKAQKILKRTLVGGSLAGVLALILWWTSRGSDGLPIYWVSAAVLMATVYETSRMGTLALRDLFPALALAAVSALVLTYTGIESAAIVRAHTGFPATAQVVLGPNVWITYGFATLVALAAYGLTSWHPSGLPRSFTRVLAYCAIGAALLTAVQDAHTSHRNLLIASACLALIGAGSAVRILTQPEGRTRIWIVAGLGLWLMAPLPSLWQLWNTFGMGALVGLIVLSKIGDTCGYYVGNAIGKSHPFPRISPGKTTAGCVASLIGASAMAAGLYAFDVLPRAALGLPAAIAAGALINIAAQAGDLLESWVKRRVGVKDSSGWFGPSGGLLDQIDSLLLTIPTALATWPWIFDQVPHGLR
jgi:phosphatidate cytidylyltransferase